MNIDKTTLVEIAEQVLRHGLLTLPIATVVIQLLALGFTGNFLWGFTWERVAALTALPTADAYFNWLGTYSGR